MFKDLDENHDGYISVEELEHYMKRNASKNLGINLEELKNIIDCIDTDKNGKINYNEFIASTLGDQLVSSKDNLKNVFSMMDKDGNGFIDQDELLGILKQHGHISSEKVLRNMKEIFATTDTNKDGKIDFDEFCNTICQIITWSLNWIWTLYK